MAAPWVNGADFKRLMLQYPNTCIVLVLTRDQDAGRVAVDRAGRPRIHYSLSKRDEASMLKVGGHGWVGGLVGGWVGGWVGMGVW